jgi:hypothetical protein
VRRARILPAGLFPVALVARTNTCARSVEPAREDVLGPGLKHAAWRIINFVRLHRPRPCRPVWAALQASALAAAIPAKVSGNERAIVTAGLAMGSKGLAAIACPGHGAPRMHVGRPLARFGLRGSHTCLAQLLTNVRSPRASQQAIWHKATRRQRGWLLAALHQPGPSFVPLGAVLPARAERGLAAWSGGRLREKLRRCEHVFVVP